MAANQRQNPHLCTILWNVEQSISHCCLRGFEPDSITNLYSSAWVHLLSAFLQTQRYGCLPWPDCNSGLDSSAFLDWQFILQVYPVVGSPAKHHFSLLTLCHLLWSKESFSKLQRVGLQIRAPEMRRCACDSVWSADLFCPCNDVAAGWGPQGMNDTESLHKSERCKVKMCVTP